MEKTYSIRKLTDNLKDIVIAIKKEIAVKGILNEESMKDDLSLFSGYIANTIISDFENTLRTTFKYPETIVEYINKRFSLGGYYFYKKFQEPFLTRDDGTKMTLEEYPIESDDQSEMGIEIRKAFSTSKITYKGVEWDIPYFPILNLTKFTEINELFSDNKLVIGFPKIIYNASTVSTLERAFKNCISLHTITLEANAVSYVPLRSNNSNIWNSEIFNNCIVLEDFDFINIIPTNITSLANNNDITAKALEKLDLTHITSVGDLGYTFSKSNNGKGFTPNLYMPRCLNAKNMLQQARFGCGNLTFGVGCLVNANTFGACNTVQAYSPNVGIISGLTQGVDLAWQRNYNATSIHNWLYSVATDVRTYGHPDDSTPDNVRKLTFHANVLALYEGSDLKTNDEIDIVYIQDTLTDENTLDFFVGDNELEALKSAISSSGKTPELYDAIYNRNNNTRYYITSLDGKIVADFHKCPFTIFEDNGKEIARLKEGTIFYLMNERCWTYE